MNQVGSVSLIASLAFAAYALVAGAVGGKLRSPRITRSAERAALGFFLMIYAGGGGAGVHDPYE